MMHDKQVIQVKKNRKSILVIKILWFLICW